MNKNNRRSFPDNYRALVAAFLLLFISFTATSQVTPYDSTKGRQDVKIYGNNYWGNYRFGGSLVIPVGDTITLAVADSGAVMFYNDGFYGWNGYSWGSLGGVGSTTVVSDSAWMKKGNAGTDPLTDFIGTTDSIDFVIKTNGIEQLRYKANGDWLLPKSSTFLLNSNRLSITGTGSQDASYFESGDILHSIGTANSHGFLQLSKTPNGSAYFQLLAETGQTNPVLVETEGIADTVNNTASWHTHVDKSGSYHSHINISDTGISLKAGTSSATAKGININLNGAIGIGDGTDYGTSGYVFTSQGNAAAPIWTAPGSTNTSIGSAYKIAVDGTNDIKSLSAEDGLIADSSESGQVRYKMRPVINFTDMVSTGDSYAGTFGISTFDSNFIKISSTKLDITLDPYSTGGATSAQMNYVLYQNQNPFDIDKATFSIYGYNDVSSYAFTEKTNNKIYNCFTAAVINQFLDTAIAANDALVTASGSWADTSTFTVYGGKANSLSGLGKFSSSGTSLSYDFSGTNIVVGYIGSDGSILGGSLEVYIDAVRVDSFSTNNQTDGVSGTDSYPGDGISCVKYYYGLSAGAHTIEVRRISGSVIVDYFGQLQTDELLCKPFFIGSGQKVPQQGWTVSGVGVGSNETMNIVNTIKQKVIGEIRNINKSYPVYFIDINKFTDFTTDFYTDYVHFNGLGNIRAASSVIYFIQNLSSYANGIDPVTTPALLPGDRVTLSQITLPVTTNQNTGVVKFGSSRFLHNFPSALNNTFLGDAAGRIDAGTTTQNTTGIGFNALNLISTGLQNTAVGSLSLKTVSTGSYNTAVGFNSGASLNGAGNVVFGTNSMIFNSSGNHNAAFGFQALYNNTGSANVGIGTNAGQNITSGTFNTTIGIFSNATSATGSGQLNIGNILYGTGMKQDYVASSSPTASGKIGILKETPTSTLDVAGSFGTAYRAITALRTLDGTDHTINCTSGTYTVTLPTAASITGRQYVIVNSGSGTITIGTTSSQTFVNINATPTTLTLAPVGAGAIVSYTVVSNGANWIVTAKVKDE